MKTATVIRNRMLAGAFGLLLALALIAALAVPVLAFAQLPHTFYGGVSSDGGSVAQGTRVSAFVGGEELAFCFVDELSQYGYGADPLVVPADDPETTTVDEGAEDGEIVTFEVGGTPATAYDDGVPVLEVLFSRGGLDNLDLVLGELVQYTLSIDSTDCGNVTVPGEGDFVREVGAEVDLLAEPDDGCCFVGWTGDVGTVADDTAASTTITMNGNYDITANFVAEVVLTTASDANGNVTVPGEGDFPYCPGEVVPLVAEGNLGYAFDEWTGEVTTVDDVNAASTTITMDASYAITANFIYVGTSELTTSSTAGGAVTDPGEPGPFTYTDGQVVPIEATADEGFCFDQWTGDVGDVTDVNAAATTITMNGNYTVTANFVAKYDLTVSSTAGGTVTDPGEDTFSYCPGEVVPLVAEADTGYEFVDWTGPVADPDSAETTITMDDDYSVQANFEEAAVTYTLTIQKIGSGTTSPAVGDHPGYTAGVVVPISASPGSNYAFSSWTGDVGTVANPNAAITTITMNDDYTITANFSYTGGDGGGGWFPPAATPTPTPTVTVAPTPTPVVPPPTLPTGETIDLSDVIDEDGVVQDDVQQDAFAGTVSISIPAGTTALTAEGEPLTEITIEEVCFGFPPPPANAYIIGCAYDYGPDGATFDPPIEINIKYDPGLLPAGVDEEDLTIAYYDVSKGQWVELPSTVDTVNNTVMAEVSGFTYFAVYAPAPPEPTPTIAPATPTPTPTPTPVEDEGGFPVYGIVLIVIAAIVVIALVIYYFMRRRGGAEAEA